jgi:hypothetical protein
LNCNMISFASFAYLRFSPEEIDVMKKCARGHYDHKCKMLVHRQAPIGLLIRVENYHRNTATDPSPSYYKFSWDDLDTITKACEAAQYLYRKKEREIGFDLHWKFRQVLRAMSENRPAEIEIDQSKLPGPWTHRDEEEKPPPRTIEAVGALLHLFSTGKILVDAEGREVTALSPSDDGGHLLAEFDHDNAEAVPIDPAELKQKEASP